MTKRKKNFTPISKLTREKGMLKSGLSQLNFQMIDWERDLMPEHLWIELLSAEFKDLAWTKMYDDFLDKFDDCFVTKPQTPALGLLSDFALPNEQERNQFIEKNKDFIYHAFFRPIGKILSLYPKNPANWLILEEWKNKEPIKFEAELLKLSNSLERLIKGKDLHAGHIRALPLSRLFKHNKLFLPAGAMQDLQLLLPKYPGNCTEDEQYRVQQFARNTLNMNLMAENRYAAREWPKYFWRHNQNLAICTPVPESLDRGDNLSKEQILDLQKQTWDNSVRLMKYVDKVSAQYKYDLYDPRIDEIKLGLFSRVVRLCYRQREFPQFQPV